MKKYLPAVLVVLAAVGGYFLLLDPGEEEVWDPDWTEAPEPPAPDGGMQAAGLEAEGVAPPKGGPKKRKAYKTVDPRTLPRGTLIVTPVGPDLKPIDGTYLRIYVESVRPGGFPTKLGRLDKDSGSWRFEKVRAGKVSVRLFSDHVVRKKQVVSVRAERDNQVTIEVLPAGAIQYDVILYDKTRPEKVRLQLYDWQDKPIKAWYQVRSTKSMTSPRQAMTITQGAEGVVMGLLPGRYRLRVVSENDEWDDVEVMVEAGKTHKASLEVRR